MSDPERIPHTEPTPESQPAVGPGFRVSSGMKSFLLFLVFLAVCAAIHHRGFRSPMIYDSTLWIERKAHVFDRGNVMDVIAIVPKRPLFMASLYINHAVTGMEAAAFRVVNAVFVAATGLALVWLLVVLLRIRGPDSGLSPTEQFLIAGSLGMLFVVHPLQTFVVLYIWQREAIMACFFCFATLAVYLAARSGRIRHQRIAYASTGLLFFAGLNCKENLVSLPVLMFAAEALLLVHYRSPRPGAAAADSPSVSKTAITVKRRVLKDLARRLLLVGLITVPPLIAYLAITHHLHGMESVHDQGIRDRLLGYYEMSGIGFFQVLMTECRVLFSYLTMIAAPFAQPLLLIEARTVSSSLWSPPTTILAVVGVLGLLAAVPLLAGRRPLTAFGILFFFISSAPEALLIPQYLYFGYRAVLPMAGVLIVLADGVSFLMESSRKSRRAGVLRPALVLFMIAVSVGFAAITVSRAGKWMPRIFWTEEYAHLPPHSEQVERVPYVTVLVNLAATLSDSVEYREAGELLRTARRIYPAAPTITLDLGKVLTKTGDTTEAEELLRALVRERPEIAGGWIALSRALMDQGKTDEGIDKLKEAVRKFPKDRSLQLKLAEALTESGKIAEALGRLKLIPATDPHYPAALVQMGFAFKKSGNLPQAARLFRRALREAPGSRDALMGLLVVEKELAGSGRTPQRPSEPTTPAKK